MADIDGKLVILRGPAGRLARPDAPNTGPWASLGNGWRGMLFDATAQSQHRATKLANGRYTFTNIDHECLAGADATVHSGNILAQFYYKPSGNTLSGGYEEWRCYDGNENGAIEAQIEYDNDEGRYFSCPVAVEVVG
jgi:hypothetical protein